MAQQNLAFVGLAVAAGVGAKAAELPTPFAGFLAVAALGVCMGVKNLLNVEVPKPQPKAKKKSPRKRSEPPPPPLLQTWRMRKPRKKMLPRSPNN